MSLRKLNGMVVYVALTGLTACGGATTSQVPSVDSADQIPQLIAAPALDTLPVDTLPVDEATDITDLNSVTGDTPVAEVPTEQGTPFVANLTLLSGAADVACDAEPAVFNQTMLELVNASRAEMRMCGANVRGAVQSLAWNDRLATAAAMHANDMALNNFFSHDGSDGLSVSDRAVSAGYSWRAVGENIAAGQLDQAEVHQGWLDSEGHCFNIMNQLFTEVGAACVSNSGTDFGTYWVVVFGDAK